MNKYKNYIIIGDSITYGIGDFETGGWAAMFKNYIVNQDDSKVCTNLVHIAGFPGATSRDILSKLDNIIGALEDDEFDNVVILSIGVNDAKYFNGDFKVSKEEYKENIKKIIEKVTARGFELVILGLTRVEIDDLEYKPGKFYYNSNIEEYEQDLKVILNNDEALKELCAEEKIKYISLKDTLQKEDYIDGLHPNTNGHRKMFEAIKEQIVD
jgi:lysophospholipase L1-like esterase